MSIKHFIMEVIYWDRIALSYLRWFHSLKQIRAYIANLMHLNIGLNLLDNIQ